MYFRVIFQLGIYRKCIGDARTSAAKFRVMTQSNIGMVTALHRRCYSELTQQPSLFKTKISWSSRKSNKKNDF